MKICGTARIFWLHCSYNPIWHGIFGGLILGEGICLGFVGSPRDFLGGLDFLSPFDYYPCHLKPGVPSPLSVMHFIPYFSMPSSVVCLEEVLPDNFSEFESLRQKILVSCSSVWTTYILDEADRTHLAVDIFILQ